MKVSSPRALNSTKSKKKPPPYRDSEFLLHGPHIFQVTVTLSFVLDAFLRDPDQKVANLILHKTIFTIL